ncbi:Plug domain-containing protein [Colwellia sp. Arc7-635]|uniref:Plug domain-containing protein n=1 Tax=Colwellia sp. Arc7-635 TaxID=2497879 RepID=UPI0026C3A0A1
MNISKSSISIAITTALMSLSSVAQSNSVDDIERITVTSSFNNQPLAQAATSVAIIGEQQINDQAIQHFEELINSVANLNFSGGTSRPKYLQIRGVGSVQNIVVRQIHLLVLSLMILTSQVWEWQRQCTTCSKLKY